jgi:paraquat-inducible protein B
MINRADPRVIGGFVLGAVLLAVVVFMVFGSGKYFVERQTYVVYFPSTVSGLAPGDPVKVKGITIGSVKGVKPLFSPDGEFHAEVFVELQGEAIRDLTYRSERMTREDEMQELFRRGLRAQLGVASLITGKQYVNLDLYPETEAVLKGFNTQYVEIPAVPTRTEELQATLENVIKTIQELDIAGLVETSRAALASIDSLAGSAELRSAIVSLNHAMVAADTLMVNLNTDLAEVSDNLRRASDAIAQSADRAEDLFSRLDGVVAEEEVEFRQTMIELEKAARSIRYLAEQLEQQPSSVIRGKQD